MFAQQRVGEVTVNTETWEGNIQTGDRGGLRFLLSLPLSPVARSEGLTRLVVPSRSLGGLSGGYRGAGLGVLAHHPVVSSLDLLLTVVRVEQQAGSHRDIRPGPLGWRLVLLSRGGVVTKPDQHNQSVSQSAQSKQLQPDISLT